MLNEIKYINAADISDPENPMRSEIDRERVYDLADSIRREGLINPITVRPKGSRYEVVAGHRRFVACRIANVIEIPCVVRDLTDDQAQDIMAHENLERQDVDPVDEALFLGRLVGEDDAKIPNVAERLNRSVQWVRDRLEILTYPEYMIVAIRDGTLKLGVAAWLAPIDDDFWRKQYVNNAIGQGMSVLQARYLHDQYAMGVTPKSTDILPDESELARGAPAAPRAPCAACGKIAVDPNLQNVFIHKVCPSESEAAPSPSASDSSVV
jgi:ParB family chromosome partitioning protein